MGRGQVRKGAEGRHQNARQKEEAVHVSPQSFVETTSSTVQPIVGGRTFERGQGQTARFRQKLTLGFDEKTGHDVVPQPPVDFFDGPLEQGDSEKCGHPGHRRTDALFSHDHVNHAIHQTL